MLHISDDNDAIFQKAAEEYPLDTRNADWEAMRSKMIKTALPQKNTNRRWVIFPLLAVFLASALFTSDLVRPTLKHHFPIQPETKVQPNGHSNATEIPEEKLTAAANHPSSESASLQQSSFIPIKHNISDNASHTKFLTGDSLSNLSSVTTGLKVSVPLEIEKSELELSDSVAPDIVENKNGTTPHEGSKQQAGKRKKMKTFYVGITGGAEVSMVKLQSVKKAGFSYGLVTGISLSPRWSLQSGVSLEKKYYNTDGKYFNTKNIPLPNYVKINYADGYCNMILIPVNMKYKFSRGVAGWFASTGITSYVMKKEEYTYDITRYGISYKRKVSYNNSRTTLAAALNISGGYTLKARNAQLKIEPYIRLPLRKIGIGELPLQSAGVQVSATRYIF